MFLTVVLPLFFLVTFVPVTLVLYGITRWQTETSRIRDRLEETRESMPTRVFDVRELEGLPAPVQHFLMSVLAPGQPLIAVAEIGQGGKIDFAPEGESPRWASFDATQVVVTQRPGFDWGARVRALPGLRRFVHEFYIAGEGARRTSLSGLLGIEDHRDTQRLAQAQLTRFLAESAWYPTKLLPSQGVRWEPIDENSALATLADGEVQASLTFVFDEDGLLRRVRANEHARMHRGQIRETPWEMRFWGYETRTGIRVPTQAEAAWILAGERHPYWQGQVTDVLYKFTP